MTRTKDLSSNCLHTRPFWEKIVNEQVIIRFLDTMTKDDAVPQSLLFSGIKGIGKHLCAKVFAMACNCSSNSGMIKSDYRCSCSSCRKISNDIHPDIIEIKEPGFTIKIDAIRNLCDILALKPFEAKHRFVLIYDAEKMTKEGGNALLNILEEPPEKTCFILTSSNISELLPTIISRCRHIRFSPLTDESIAIFLRDRYGVSEDNASIIGKMAEGSLENALLLKDEKPINHRKWLLGELESVTSKPIVELLILAEILSADKSALRDSLKIIKSWIRDIMVFCFLPDKIVNSDFKAGIKRAAVIYDKEGLYSNIYAIEEIERRLSSGMNIRLALENMIFKIGMRL